MLDWWGCQISANMLLIGHQSTYLVHVEVDEIFVKLSFNENKKNLFIFISPTRLYIIEMLQSSLKLKTVSSMNARTVGLTNGSKMIWLFIKLQIRYQTLTTLLDQIVLGDFMINHPLLFITKVT